MGLCKGEDITLILENIISQWDHLNVSINTLWKKKKKGDQYNRGQITKTFQKMQDEKHETIREVGKNWGGFSVLVEWTNLQLISCLQMALYMKTIVLSHLIMTGPT